MLYAIAASAGDIMMNRRQLRGIKARAERLAQARNGSLPPAAPTSAQVPQ
jgi:hypothetical protein